MATRFTIENDALTDGDKYMLGLERVTKLSFARHLAILYYKNSNYGELIMLWNVKGLQKNKPCLMKHVLHPLSPWLPIAIQQGG